MASHFPGADMALEVQAYQQPPTMPTQGWPAAQGAPVAADPSAATLAMITPITWLIVIGVAALAFWPYAEIFRKSGRSPWLALLLLVPFVNFVVYFWMAFGRWPVLEQLRAYQAGMIPPGAPAPGYASHAHPRPYPQTHPHASSQPVQGGGWSG